MYRIFCNIEEFVRDLIIFNSNLNLTKAFDQIKKHLENDLVDAVIMTTTEHIKYEHNGCKLS